jgi:thiol-disulfide isomerase/thioredoxin
MNKIAFLALLSFSLLLFSCGGGKGDAPKTRSFAPVSVPSLISADEGKAQKYVIDHYWDRFADTSLRGFRCDSNFIGGVSRGELEQAFANFAYVLELDGLESYARAMKRFYEKMALCEQVDSSSNIYEGMMDIACRYLYDPNSPLRDEEMYLPLCRRLASCPYQDSLSRVKFAKEAENCSLNRIGQTAADFSFSDRKGRVYHLHEIKADWTILFFSNPGCKACKDIIEYIKSIEGITPMIIANHVAVVNVYIDEDLGEWYDYMPYYPKNWYNGYDHNLMVRSENLYDVRAIPSLYLLDKDKKVVLKDAPEDKFYAKLNQLL